MRVFVTVGTTCFDELVDMISSAEVLEVYFPKQL